MRRLKSLSGKFLRTMVLVTSVIGMATLAVVVWTSAQASSEHLRSVQRYIEEGISSKGRVLTENHALALGGLTLDNAFLDIRQLVGRAVQEDSDLVYGLYVNSDRETLAYSRRGLRQEAGEPNHEAWRELRVPEPELLVTKPVVRRASRLGQDLLEVAVPVLGEDGEVLGTIRYGLSTRMMHDALAQAKTEARARLNRSVLLIGSVVLGAILLGILLSRIQAGRITRPLGDLTVAAEKLAAGDRAVRVQIDSGDELGVLGASFNRMVGDLDASYSKLEEMNRTLEHRVEERTLALASKNRDMRLVLDNVDQGFLTLSPEGLMAIERSRVVGQWFGESQASLPLWEYIGASSPDFAMRFQLGWEQLTDGLLPQDLCLAQLPERLERQGRTFSFSYLPFHKEGQLEGVLVVIAEITEKLASQREEAEQNEMMQAFKRLMLDRRGFRGFMHDASSMVRAIGAHTSTGDDIALRRTLHTLKGNVATMGFSVVAGLCHTLETELDDVQAMRDATLAELRERWAVIEDHVAAFAGTSQGETLEVGVAEYNALVSTLSQEGRANPDTLQQVVSWRLEPAERIFGRLADQAKALARRLEKGEIQVEIQANGLRLDSERWNPLFSELGHVVRNAVDHGIESPIERSECSKPPNGKISIRAQVTANTLVVQIGDDGRGIDWEAIRQKAKQGGLPSETPADLLNVLCADGITTRSSVSAISGRGVGMAAVKERVSALNGRLDVKSTPGVGTNWILSFPWTVPGPKSTTAFEEPSQISRTG